MSAKVPVQHLCHLLVKSRLLSAEEVKAHYQRWQANPAYPLDGADAFRRQLLADSQLTTYQLAQLDKGRTEGFFLGQYKILDRIGKGRMSGVYKAVHATGQIVAIKALAQSKAKDPVLLGRFQRECRLALPVRHPNVVRAFAVGQTGGVHYLVMECLEGETLEDVLARRGKLPPTEAVRLIHQSLQGLQALHERGIVHRDLKPANLMLVGPVNSRFTTDNTLSATVKVLDIGLARALSDDPEQDGETPLTSENVLLGTPDYLAPEQARHARMADVRADVYSLGCVLYRCLSGRTPFPDSNVLSMVVRHATEAPRPLSDFTSEVTPALQQVVGWMMAKEPAQRYQTPERAAQALQSVQADLTDLNSDVDLGAPLPAYQEWLDSSPTLPSVDEVAAEAAPTPTFFAPVEAGPEPPTDAPGVVLVPVGGLSETEPLGLLPGDRRDFLMLGIGGLGTLAAIALGWLFARLAAGSPGPSDDTRIGP